jgi:formylglycine-generating enzyme required for sulfatase activity
MIASFFASSSKTATEPASAPHGAVPSLAGAGAPPLLTSLGIEATDLDASHGYSKSSVRDLILHHPRRVTLGSTPEQIRAAFAMCRQYASGCQPSWYDDERLRSVTLEPYEVDPLPVSVHEFRQFVEAKHYTTEAEKLGFAYAVVNGKLESVSGGNWRNWVKKHPVEDDSPVVGVSFQDALAYCRAQGARLPSENEWEYVARGPQRRIFAWGDEIAPAARAYTIPPHVMDGPAQGIGGRYHGLSGSVWQWVNTKMGERKVLKGGSWLETNPANKRAATRLYKRPDVADEDSGFRCARSVPQWPDAELWLSQIK